MDFSIICATNLNNCIGKNGDLLYKSKLDMEYFKKVTSIHNDSSKYNAVIMGRKTWESIPTKYRPLPNRLNIVLSKNKNFTIEPPSLTYDSFNTALNELSNRSDIENIFIIGGEQLYKEAINHKYCQYIYITVIDEEYKGDTFFPIINMDQFELVRQENITDDKCLFIPENKNIKINLSFKVYKSFIRYSS